MYHGIIPKVIDFIHEDGEFTVTHTVEDCVPNEPSWRFTGTFRPLQEDAVNAICDKRFGIVKAVMRFGKTVVIAAATTKLQTSPTTIIIYQQDVLKQFKQTFEDLTNIRDVGTVGDDSRTLGKVTIYTAQALLAAKARGNNDPVWQHYLQSKIVFVDECHHGAADGSAELLDYCKQVHALIGVSGTPWREDGKSDHLQALFGNIIMDVTFSDAVENDLICPMTVFVENVPPKNYGVADQLANNYATVMEKNPNFTKRQYKRVYDDYIVNNVDRHKIIASIANDCREEGLTCAIIVKIKKHGEQLHRLIPGSRIVVASTKTRKDDLEGLRNRSISCIITTLLDEAVDIPSLDVVILAAGGRSSIKLNQRLRNLTKFKGYLTTGYYEKKRAYVFYLYDRADFLKTHSEINIRQLKQIVKQHKTNEFIWSKDGI